MSKTLPRSAQQQVTDSSDPFWEYCAEYWTQHLRGEFVQHDKSLLNSVISLYTTNTDLFSRWFPIYWEIIYPYDDQVENLQY